MFNFAPMKGKLFLIPSPLGDNNPEEVIPSFLFERIKEIRHFAVEELRTARRYLSRIGFRGRIDELSFYEINEHTKAEDVESYIKVLLDGQDMGLISEAGLPAVADPGADLVALAHRYDIEVVPFVGPSSLMLALMSSGMNGQCFSFCGYIPVKSNERRDRIKEIEKRSRAGRETVIFIETPYRNDHLFADILGVCDKRTRLCIAADITLPTSFIQTKTIGQWKAANFKIGKRPCVFLILA